MSSVSSSLSARWTPSTWKPLVFAAALLLIIGAALFLGVSEWHQPDAYTQAVLKLEGNPDNGQVLFTLNCSGCHGSEADGRVGPSLHGVSERRSDISLIEQVTSGKTLPMPQFQPEPAEMAHLLSYLKSL
ncbi:MAG: cytochrome c [Cyanobacteria bacterium P01_E01_bin.34]